MTWRTRFTLTSESVVQLPENPVVSSYPVLRIPAMHATTAASHSILVLNLRLVLGLYEHARILYFLRQLRVDSSVFTPTALGSKRPDANYRM